MVEMVTGEEAGPTDKQTLARYLALQRRPAPPGRVAHVPHLSPASTLTPTSTSATMLSPARHRLFTNAPFTAAPLLFLLGVSGLVASHLAGSPRAKRPLAVSVHN